MDQHTILNQTRTPTQSKFNSSKTGLLQRGFSLIELLVVVAIIGVLSSAGIVGYQKYLDGVKADTHKGNAKTLAAALKTTGVARVSGLTINPDVGCNKKPPAGTLPAGIVDLEATLADCAGALGAEFKSPYASTKKGADYISSGTGLGAVPTSLKDVIPACQNNKGKLVVYSDNATATAKFAVIVSCSNDDVSIPLSFEVIPAGAEWSPS